MTIIIAKSKRGTKIFRMKGTTTQGNYVVRELYDVGTYELDDKNVLEVLYNIENIPDLKQSIIEKHPQYFL